VFYLDIVKVDQNVAYYASVFKCFHMYVASVSSGCMFAYVYNGYTRVFKFFLCFASVSDMCCKYFNCMDENDRKRSIGGQITFIFTVFSRKRNQYNIVINEYDTDIPLIPKTIVVDRKIHR
jgi:hypothetical protein